MLGKVITIMQKNKKINEEQIKKNVKELNSSIELARGYAAGNNAALKQTNKFYKEVLKMLRTTKQEHFEDILELQEIKDDVIKFETVADVTK